MEATTERGPELLNVTVSDWEGTRQAHLEGVPRNATVAELIAEASRVMELSADIPYQVVLGDRRLNHMETLEEAGIEPGAEMEVVPEVSAGQP